MRLTCKSCGVESHRSGGQALFCLPCANKPRPRIAPMTRFRQGVVQAVRVGGKKLCVECRNEIQPEFAPSGRKLGGRLRCDPCHVARKQQRRAIQSAACKEVARAVATGALPRPETLACADCGSQARHYDHRDYTQPLKVEPVCRSCNVLRGPAIVWTATTQGA